LLKKQRLEPAPMDFLECSGCGKRFVKPTYTAGFTFTNWIPTCPICKSKCVEPLSKALARKMAVNFLTVNKFY